MSYESIMAFITPVIKCQNHVTILNARTKLTAHEAARMSSSGAVVRRRRGV